MIGQKLESIVLEGVWIRIQEATRRPTSNVLNIFGTIRRMQRVNISKREGD